MSPDAPVENDVNGSSKSTQPTNPDQDIANDNNNNYPNGRPRGGLRWNPRRIDGAQRPNDVDVEIPDELIPEGALDISLPKCKNKLWFVPLNKEELQRENATPTVTRRFMIAQVRYKAWLATDPEKKIINASSLYEGDDAPMEFTIGLSPHEREVLLALDVGVQNMSFKGEKALLIAHFEYAFGRNSESRYESSNIPNMSFICIELELVDAFFAINRNSRSRETHSVEERDVILRVTHAAAERFDRETNCVIFVELEGYFKKTLFLQKQIIPFEPLHMTWGLNENSGIGKRLPKGLGNAVKTFVVANGKCGHVTLRKGGAYAEDVAWKPIDGKEDTLVVPADEEVEFSIRIHEVEEVFDPFTRSIRQKIDICRDLLSQACEHLGQKYYEAAAMKIQRVKEYLLYSEPTAFLTVVPEDLEKAIAKRIFFACFLMGKMYGKLDPALFNEKAAIENWSEAVNLDKLNQEFLGMAYFERGLLYWNVKEFELASKDFEECLHRLNIYFGVSKEAPLKGILKNSVEKDEESCENLLDKALLGEKEVDFQLLISNVKVLLNEVKEKVRNYHKNGFVLRYVPPK